MPAKDRLRDFFKSALKVNPAAPLLALSTYILLLLSRLIDSSLLDRSNEYLNVILLQILIFLVPAAVFYRVRGNRYKEKLKLHAFHPESVLLIIFAAGVMICGGILINTVFGFNNPGGSFSLYGTFISKNDGSAANVIYLVLAYAALPAFCEETVYRGMICSEYEDKGFFCCASVSAFMFALLHFNISQFPVYIFTGFVLVWVLYITRSLFCTMLIHFCYNLFGLFVSPYISSFYSTTGATELFVFIITVLFLIFALLFCGIASRLCKHLARAGANPEYRTDIHFADSALYAGAVLISPVSLVSIIIYILTVVFTF